MAFPGYIVGAAGAYLLGSIPTGYLVARARRVDIRSAGSGNIGATNAFRVLGRSAGIFVLLVDGLKGFAACAWLADLIIQFFSVAPSGQIVIRIVAGVFVVLGHNYTCWLKFKGGKGIATSAGVLAELVPVPLLIILSVWIILFVLTRYVSVGSLAAAFTLPFATWFTTSSWMLTFVTGALSVLAIYRHKGNIQRLVNGTESRVSFKGKGAAP